MAKQLSGFTKVEVKNTAAGGAVGTTYAELPFLTETGSISFEPPATNLSDGNMLAAGGLNKGEFEVLDGAASLATIANLRTDVAAGVKFTVKFTAVDTKTYEIASVLLNIAESVSNKPGEHKLFKVTFSKNTASYGFTEA
jgi:hypothetical protein